MRSIKIKFFLQKCLFGLNMVGLGIFYQSRTEGWDYPAVMFISGSFVLAYFVLGFLLDDRMKFEPEDEMTKQHEYRAQAGVYLMLCCLLCIIGISGMLSRRIQEFVHSLELSWEYAFYLVGVLQFVEYALFIRIERQGDPIE